MLSCRGREKFPTFMVLGTIAGERGTAVSSGDGVVVGNADLEVAAVEVPGRDVDGRESSVELEIRPGAIMLGTNGCDDRPAKGVVEADEFERVRKRLALAANVLCVGEMGLVGAVENPAEATDVCRDEVVTIPG